MEVRIELYSRKNSEGVECESRETNSRALKYSGLRYNSNGAGWLTSQDISGRPQWTDQDVRRIKWRRTL